MKRFLTLVLAIALTAMIFLPLAASAEEVAPEDGYYYVYVEKGTTLNVRDQPSYKGKVVGLLPYGYRIHVQAFTNENWALITYHYRKPGYGMGDYSAWINRRYLTTKKPAPKSETQTTRKAVVTEITDPLDEINKEYRSAKDVQDYAVIVRPTRVTGWVNMHWAPSVNAEIEATYKANDKLLVIKELDNWLQVEDQVTGNVGFIKKSLVNE